MIYIEALGKAAVANGAARIETRYRNSSNVAVRGEDLIVPLNQLPALIQSLQALVARVGAGAAPEAAKPPSATEDQKLWACALQVHRRHGDKAAVFVARRLKAFADAGDSAGIEAWQAIGARIDQLRQAETSARQ